MYRTHNNGQLRAADINKTVTLAGWVQKTRDKGFMVWVDLRDRYGITQLIFDEERTSKEVMEKATKLGREFVIQVTGTVIERESKNPNMPTGTLINQETLEKIIEATKQVSSLLVVNTTSLPLNNFFLIKYLNFFSI